MTKKIFWIITVGLAIIIGLYPFLYFFIDRKFGLLSTKSTELLANIYWNIGFYTHIILGGVALLIGWTQFNTWSKKNRLTLHRQIGKIYVIAVILSSLSGIYIAFFATGGLVSSLGFFCLGAIWFYTTVQAYLHIKNKQILQHQKMMIYSYASCLAAVTLRIWLPLLTMAYGNFEKAYILVSWLCWVPNIIVANSIVKQLKK